MRRSIAVWPSTILFILASVITFFRCETARTPATAEGFITVGDIQLYYKTIGHGEPLVILHGGPGLDHTCLLPQMQALAHDNKLIFYDQRATGRSTGEVDSASMTIDRFVEDLEAVRSHFKLDKMNLLGHSWGGLLAMAYAIEYPQRVKSLVLAGSVGATGASVIALSDTRQARTTPEDAQAFGELVASEGFAQADPEVVQAVARLLFKTDFKDGSLLDSLTLNFNERTARNSFAIFNALTPYLQSYDLTGQLGSIACPTLVIHGDYDPFPAAGAEELARLIPQAQFQLVPDCGHWLFVESPEVFFAAVRQFEIALKSK